MSKAPRHGVPDFPVDRPTVDEVLPLVRAYYTENPVGGGLHIVLDDDNIDDHHIVWCGEQAVERGDEVTKALADLLLRMTKTQRRKLCASDFTSGSAGWTALGLVDGRLKVMIRHIDGHLVDPDQPEGSRP